MTATLKRKRLVAASLAIVLLSLCLIPFLKRGASLTERDSRMAAPGRPAVSDADTNTTPNTRTAEGGHPTDRADWPEWAQEMRQPPPLEEWLQGRKVLTVKQDGSAMFQTIQAALDKVQPGEVIRVLDKGPYRERLVSQNHPGNFGLVRSGAVHNHDKLLSSIAR